VSGKNAAVPEGQRKMRLKLIVAPNRYDLPAEYLGQSTSAFKYYNLLFYG